ncbi:hypothetical protein HON58_01855 [Candidatus Peregrinibacteria bacterium]|nr:hypothetical protein [Candidatus Peregrinibacteria bacterium]
MPHPKPLHKDQKGFIAIVALGVFALMAVFGIIAQTVAMTTVKSVRNTNSYYEAKDITDAIDEYLQYQVSNSGAGQYYDLQDELASSGLTECDFSGIDMSPNKGETLDYIGSINNSALNTVCGNFLTGGYTSEALETSDDIGDSQYGDILAGGGIAKNEAPDPQLSYINFGNSDVIIKKMTISGRNKVGDQYHDCNFGNGECYVTPIKGKGDALGDINVNCDELTSGDQPLLQLEHPCNWNVLKHGSSATDRVTIPLYYTNDDGTPNHAFENCTSADTCQLTVRIRPSCKYKYDDFKLTLGSAFQGDPIGFLSSAEAGDACDDERWTLTTQEPEKAVVQWQITGECIWTDGSVHECGMIGRKDDNGDLGSSLIHVETISYENDWKVLEIFDYADKTGGFEESEGVTPAIFTLVSKMTKPKLTLLLSTKINKAETSDDDMFDANDIGSTFISEKASLPNSVYLEYQILTSGIIASPKIKMDVEIEVDDTVFEKTIYKYEEKELIDFAIQS